MFTLDLRQLRSEATRIQGDRPGATRLDALRMARAHLRSEWRAQRCYDHTAVVRGDRSSHPDAHGAWYTVWGYSSPDDYVNQHATGFGALSLEELAELRDQLTQVIRNARRRSGA